MSSEQQQNVLVEISNESLVKLREFYKINLPKHIIAYNFIENMIQRFLKNRENRKFVKIYTINGAVEEDATFISVLVREICSINGSLCTLSMFIKEIAMFAPHSSLFCLSILVFSMIVT